MHPNPRRVAPVILVLLLLAGGYWWFKVRLADADDGGLAASGSIEALTVNVSPELSGRVLTVTAAEGDAVTAGDVLVQFDTALVEAQLRRKSVV